MNEISPDSFYIPDPTFSLTNRLDYFEKFGNFPNILTSREMEFEEYKLFINDNNKGKLIEKSKETSIDFPISQTKILTSLFHWSFLSLEEIIFFYEESNSSEKFYDENLIKVLISQINKSTYNVFGEKIIKAKIGYGRFLGEITKDVRKEYTKEITFKDSSLILNQKTGYIGIINNEGNSREYCLTPTEFEVLNSILDGNELKTNVNKVQIHKIKNKIPLKIKNHNNGKYSLEGIIS